MDTARPLRLTIRTAVPTRRVAKAWGDHHFACALTAGLSTFGHVAHVECVSERGAHELPDAVIALRGRVRHPVEEGALNLLWIISHPERVSRAELDEQDHVFVASHPYADQLRTRTSTPVSVLLQATDATRFHPSAALRLGPVAGADPRGATLFVGNSRKVYRTMVRHALRAGLDFQVYGSQWERLIPARYIQGRHIPNERLAAYYASCGILLNDHWETMAQHGFISNRIFDASACGAFVLTDPVQGFDRVFPDSHEQIASAAELRERVAHYLAHPEQRLARAQRARTCVLSEHTFEHRARTLIEVVQTLRAGRRERTQKTSASAFRTWAARLAKTRRSTGFHRASGVAP